MAERSALNDNASDLVITLFTVLNQLAAAYNVHTHGADGSEGSTYFTSAPTTDAGLSLAGTASVADTIGLFGGVLSPRVNAD